MQRAIIAALIAIVVLAAGAGAAVYYYQPPAGASPTVSITSPTGGATVQGSSVAVTVSSTNFNVPTQGHYHIYLDNSLSAFYCSKHIAQNSQLRGYVWAIYLPPDS